MLILAEATRFYNARDTVLATDALRGLSSANRFANTIIGSASAWTILLVRDSFVGGCKTFQVGLDSWYAHIKIINFLIISFKRYPLLYL